MDYDFFYILDGTIRINHDSKTYLLSKGDVFLFEPGMKYFISSGGNNLVLTIVLDKTFVDSFHHRGSGHFAMNSAYDGSRDYEPIRQYMLQIVNTYSASDTYKNLRLSSLAFSLLYYMEEYHFEEQIISVEDHNQTKDERIQSITQHIHTNYTSSITLQDIAASMSLSVPYLSTFFKQNMGSTFNTYLNQVRLEHAVEELTYTDKSITEITYDNGFPSMNAFHKLFKEKYKTTPNKYRSEANKNRAFENSPESYAVEEVPADIISGQLFPIMQSSAHYLNDILLPIREFIRVNDMKYTKKISPIWKSMINVGDIISFDYRFLEKQISHVQETIGFKYARFEKIAKINDDSLFYQLDTCVDRLEALELVPYFEFSIPIKDLEIVDNTIIVDTNKYMDFLERFIKHCFNVHGGDYLASWYFEINPHIYIEGYAIEDPDAFIDRFEKAYNLIKSYIPRAQVGGISHNFLYTTDYIIKVIKQIKSRGIIPDFVCCGGFPYESEIDTTDPNFKDNLVYTDDKDFYLHKCREYKQLIYDIYNTTLPLHLNYMGPLKTNQLYLNDSCFQSSFLFHNIISLIDEVDVLGFYRLSDIEVEQLYKSDYLFGAPGLINRYGLEKPGAHLLNIFAKCRTNLVKKADDFIILKGSIDRYMIGLCNHTYINDVYRHNLDANIPISDAYNIFELPRTKNIELELNNLTPGNYDLIQFQINKDHGSILNEWERNNYFRSFDKDELDHLKGINKPKRTHLTKEAPDGTLKLQFQLAPHEVMFIALFLHL